MRTDGSSSSEMSPVTKGTMSSNAGRNARSTTVHVNTRPRPLTGVHVSGPPPQLGHSFSGYQTKRSHASHRGTTSSPRAAPAKYSAVRSSDRSGSGKSARFSAIAPSSVRPQDQCRRVAAREAAVDADLALRHLCRSRASQLLDDLHDVGDAEHVGVAEQPAVGVERQPTGVVEQPVVRGQGSRLALGTEAHVLDL